MRYVGKIERGTSESAGLDLFATTVADVGVLIPVTIGTGVRIAIPYGHVGIIKDRSSYGVNGHHILAGVIDSDYRGEIKVVMISFYGPLSIHIGDKFAQLIIIPVKGVKLERVESLDITMRNDKGFGSSGK